MKSRRRQRKTVSQEETQGHVAYSRPIYVTAFRLEPRREPLHDSSIQYVQEDQNDQREPLPPAPERCSGRLHQVQSGDTLYNLAADNGLSLETLLAANPQITEPSVLEVGQLVCIPQSPGNIEEIINALLTAERVEIALYARGLTSPALQGLPPEQFAYFQAGLSHEFAHANYLESIGASVPYTEFYYPPGTFEDRNVFLNTLLMIETAGVAAYIQTAIEFGRMGRFDLARVAQRTMGVEAEHRALIRSVLNLVPANNLCFERGPDQPIGTILAALPNFLQPNQFSGDSVGPVSLPTPETVEGLVGSAGCPDPIP